MPDLYEQFFIKCFNPLFETKLKGRQMLKRRAFAEESQWWDREKLLRFQWDELSRLLRHAYDQTLFWKQAFTDRNMTPDDVKTPADFERLPVMSRYDIQQHRPQMLAENMKGQTWTKSTSGSTGVPVKLDYTPESYDWRVAMWKRGYAWTGCEDGMKQAWVWGGEMGTKPLIKRYKEKIYHSVFRTRYYDSFRFDPAGLDACIADMNRYRPKYLIGFTNALYQLAQHILAGHARPTFQPQGILLCAEQVHGFQREALTAAFGCKTYNTYGCREFMLIGSECEHNDGMHLSVENLYVEILKDDGTAARPGEEGELVITDLHNYGMPFIRYRIGDLAVASDKVCPCGRGLPMMANVTGRTLDRIRTPEGREIPGQYFARLMRMRDGVVQFQIIQNKPDELDVHLQKSAEFRDADLEYIQQELRKTLGSKMTCHIHFVEEFHLTRTGKFRLTINNVK